MVTRSFSTLIDQLEPDLEWHRVPNKIAIQDIFAIRCFLWRELIYPVAKK